MRVIQLVDSLEAGGAERLAVNLANSLVSHVEISAMVVTRSEGALKASLKEEVEYSFLKKEKTIDFKALSRLKRFVIDHNIEVIHAHSSSYFFGCLFKTYYPKVKLIWHNHNGESRSIGKFRTKMLRIFSKWFDAVINVNEDLNDWVVNELKFKNPIYLRNFAVLPDINNVNMNIRGESGFRIVCLANLRYQKNLELLLDSFKEVVQACPKATLHLIGKDSNDDYSSKLKAFIESNELSDNVIIYGSRNDVSDLLSKMDIGAMSSKIEGLPVSLLEYGMAKLPVVVTDVGACAEVVGDHGLVVESGSSTQLTQALLQYLEDSSLRDQYAAKYHARVCELYGEQQYLNKLLPLYQSLVSS